ncbi:MAG: toll/interleukin-1 receptor domain-containing protein [Aggregatilineales bacterium]
MNSFGYLKVSENGNHVLTLRAFDLLRTPVTPPTIFISYRRNTSSALSLLIEARLKLVDRNINVFIDKLLEPGDEWHAELEARVRQSRYFVCLLAPKSLESKFVPNEITWALNEKQKRSDFLIIPTHMP